MALGLRKRHWDWGSRCWCEPYLDSNTKPLSHLPPPNPYKKSPMKQDPKMFFQNTVALWLTSKWQTTLFQIPTPTHPRSSSPRPTTENSICFHLHIWLWPQPQLLGHDPHSSSHYYSFNCWTICFHLLNLVMTISQTHVCIHRCSTSELLLPLGTTASTTEIFSSTNDYYFHCFNHSAIFFHQLLLLFPLLQLLSYWA